MNVREVLEKIIVGHCPGPPPMCEDCDLLAQALAPIIERAAQKAIQSGYSDGHNDALGRGPCEGSEERGMTVFVAAMMEEAK